MDIGMTGCGMIGSRLSIHHSPFIALHTPSLRHHCAYAMLCAYAIFAAYAISASCVHTPSLLHTPSLHAVCIRHLCRMAYALYAGAIFAA